MSQSLFVIFTARAQTRQLLITHHGFSMWLAGGGARGGYIHGSTDELGFAASANKVHVHDLHATILHLLGFDHEKLIYRYAGRDFRLTDVHGRVVREVVA